MKRTITIDDKEVTFVSSARTPLLYNECFRREFFKDLREAQGNEEKTAEFFSRLAYVMAKQADPSIGDIDEWFDQFGMFSIYTALPQLTDMWSVGMQTSSVPKKKASKRKGS
jgi:hypothetical protein